MATVSYFSSPAADFCSMPLWLVTISCSKDGIPHRRFGLFPASIAKEASEIGRKLVQEHDWAGEEFSVEVFRAVLPGDAGIWSVITNPTEYGVLELSCKMMVEKKEDGSPQG